MTPARWILLVLTVLGWAVAPAAARAEIGTCFTSPLPMTDTQAADCADEPDCSMLPDRALPESGGPTGPRCLEPGPTCHPGHPLLASGPDGLPFVEALQPPAPRRAPASLPLGDPLSHTRTPRERPCRPEAPPPRTSVLGTVVTQRA
ncbi:hypothetical protein L6V77_04790 [Myxococcota bacterium]|nr:hypothetical protein [Myxococcota bacterium]